MKASALVLTLLVGAALLVWIAIAQAPDGLLHVMFLDIESGQGVLIHTPKGHVVLIDGGPRPSVILSGLGRHLPFWERTLDAIVCTHAGSNALLSALEVARRYRVISALLPPSDDRPSPALLRLHQTLKERGAALREAQEGVVLELSDGLRIEIAAIIDGQASLRLSYGQVSVLLPGSTAALPQEADATVIALPTSRKNNPNVRLPEGASTIVFFDGKRSPNVPPLPARSTVQTFSTASNGSLELISDGHKATIRTGR